MTRTSLSVRRLHAFLTTLVWAWLAAWPAAAQPAGSAVQARLERELGSQALTTKVVLWNALQRSGRSQATLVDTEVYPNGTTKALLSESATPADIAPASQPADGGTLHLIPVGTPVKVTGIEVKNDQLSLLLRTVPDKFYARLRFVFGKGWDRTVTYDQVLSLVSSTLALERLERQRTLDVELRRLSDDLTAARAPVAADAPTTTLIERATHVRDLEKAVLANRAAFALASGTADAASVSEHTRALAGVEAELARLEALHRREQIADLKDAVVVAQKDAARLRPRVDKKPESFTNWKFLDQTLRQWAESVSERRGFYDQLTTLGDTVSPDDLKALEAEQDTIKARRVTLDKARAPLELVDLAEEYRVQSLRRQELQAALTKVSAAKKDDTSVAKIAEATAALAEHLRAMVANREAAERDGLKSAGQQAADLKKALDKLTSPPATPGPGAIA